MTKNLPQLAFESFWASPKPLRGLCANCGRHTSCPKAKRCRECFIATQRTVRDARRKCKQCLLVKAAIEFGKIKRENTCLSCRSVMRANERPLCFCGQPRSPNAKACMPCRDIDRRNLMLDGMKTCRECWQSKDADCFGPFRKAKDGLNAICRVCWGKRAARRYRTKVGFDAHLREHYGILFDDWNRIYQQQNGRCGACSIELQMRALDGVSTWTGTGEVPHLDHDHDTGAIRGLLCKWCNLAAQKTMTPDALRGLANYLAR